jgi:hypothetical protein
MRHGKTLGFAALAALAIAALPASAQNDPPSLFRPKPAPDSDAASVPATPETMGVSPEQFARMGVDKGAFLPNRPSRRSDGYTQYEAPLAIPGPAFRAVALAPGAVIATAAVRVDDRRWRATAPIAIAAPFNLVLPAESPFGAALDENGVSRPCLTHEPDTKYTPPKDDEGEIYPGICLGKPDGAGRYTMVTLLPYYTDRAQPRDIAIAPLALASIAAGSPDSRFGALFAVRRVRVAEVTEHGVVFMLEMASRKLPEPNGALDPFAVLADFRMMASCSLPLSDGATASLGGITLTLRRTPSGWTVEPSGSFTAWASVSDDGAKVTLGEYSVGPYPR